MRDRMDVGLFFIDYNYSDGMRMAKERFEKAGKEVREVELQTVFPERFYEIEEWVGKQDLYSELTTQRTGPAAEN